jgi:hypothetical protein
MSYVFELPGCTCYGCEAYRESKNKGDVMKVGIEEVAKPEKFKRRNCYPKNETAMPVAEPCNHRPVVPLIANLTQGDPVNNPKHYTSHPSGVECIDIVEHMPFNIGNAIKYLWRAGLKHDNIQQELDKAIWYITRESKRILDEKARQTTT